MWIAYVYCYDVSTYVYVDSRSTCCARYKRATESLDYSIYIEYIVYSNLYYYKNSEKNDTPTKTVCESSLESIPLSLSKTITLASEMWWTELHRGTISEISSMVV